MKINIASALLKQASFAIGEMFLMTLLFVVDTAMVGRLGSSSLAAVGAANLIVSVMMFVFSSLGPCVIAFISRYRGEKKPEESREVVASVQFLSFWAGILIFIVFLQGREFFLDLMGLEPEVRALAARYLMIVLAAQPFHYLVIIHKFTIRGNLDNRTPFYLTGIVNLVNAVLNYLLIFGKFGFPRLGLTGAAIATALSLILGLFLFRYFLWRNHRSLYVPLSASIFSVNNYLMRVVRLYLPSFVEQIIGQISYLLFWKMIFGLGTISIAAHQVALQVESLSFMPGWGLAMATSAYIAESLGKRKFKMASLVLSQSVRFALIFSAAICLILFLLSGTLARLFTTDTEIIAAAALCIKISVAEMPFLTLFMVFSGTLKGAGDTRTPLYISTIANYAIRIPLTWLLAYYFGWGLTGVWSATAFDWLFRASALGWVLNRGNWRHRQI